jgi:DNA recombination protein RmuC
MAQLWLIIGIALGAGAAWLVLRARIQQERDAREAERAAREHEREAHARLGDSFKALASEALQSNNKTFVDLAKSELARQQVLGQKELDERKVAIDNAIKPIADSLTKVDSKIEQLERERVQAQGALFNHLKTVTSQQEQLTRETRNLATALRAPHTRGRWGEMQLRRVCEMAGMIRHCDFVEQDTVAAGDSRLRPDVVVKLPGDKRVVIDAKVPLAAYLDAIEATDEDARKRHLQSHVRQMRDHIKKLSAKGYWNYEDAPEFVVMFVDEAMYRAAIEEAPGIIEEAIEQHVLITTPTSLLALLRTIGYSWRQEKLAESAHEIAELGRELHSRIGTFAGLFAKLGRAINSSVGAFNQAAGSFETRLLVTARKLEEHGAASETNELEGPAQIEAIPRAIQAPELEDSEEEIRVRRLNEAA